MAALFGLLSNCPYSLRSKPIHGGATRNGSVTVKRQAGASVSLAS